MSLRQGLPQSAYVTHTTLRSSDQAVPEEGEAVARRNVIAETAMVFDPPGVRHVSDDGAVEPRSRCGLVELTRAHRP